MNIDHVTFTLDNGERIVMNQHDVMWFFKGGSMLGACTLEEFRDYCAERLGDSKRTEKGDS